MDMRPEIRRVMKIGIIIIIIFLRKYIDPMCHIKQPVAIFILSGASYM